MRSVADGLRAESRRKTASLSPAARIDLALRLGDADLDLLIRARGIPRAEAVRLLARSRQVGRAVSCSAAGADQ